MKRALLLALLAAGPLLLAGCQTDPAAAAIVGNSTISQDQLTSTVDAALTDPTFTSQVGGRAAAVRVELGRLITQQIIDDLAAREHITVTPAQVNAQLQSLRAQIESQQQVSIVAYYASGGVPASQFNSVIRSIALENAVGDHLVASVPVPAQRIQQLYQQNVGQFMKVHVAHILVANKPLADRILATVKAHPDQFAALAAKYSTDTADAKKGGDLGTQSPSSYVAPFAAAVETAPVGSYVEVHSQFGWHVVHVISRTVTQTLAQATPSIKGQLLGSARQQLFQQALAAESRILHVRVNPRYGTWQASQLAVAASPDTVSSPSPSAS